MPFLRSLNRFTDLYRFTLRQAFSFGIWWPLLVFSGLSALVLLGLVFYTEPAMYAVFKPYLMTVGNLTELLGISQDFSTQFSHYPTHYRLMAGQFEWAKLPIGLLAEGIAITLAARAFARRHFDKVGVSAGESSLPKLDLKAWLRVVFVWLFIYLLISVVAYSFSNVFDDWLFGSPRRMQLFDLGLFTATNIIISPFVYVFPFVGVGVSQEQKTPSIWVAVKKSFGLFLKYPFTSVSLVLLPSFLLVYPLTWAVSTASGFASKLQPELMVYLLGGLIIGNLLVNFLYAGAATKLILEENQ